MQEEHAKELQKVQEERANELQKVQEERANELQKHQQQSANGLSFSKAALGFFKAWDRWNCVAVGRAFSLWNQKRTSLRTGVRLLC